MSTLVQQSPNPSNSDPRAARRSSDLIKSLSGKVSLNGGSHAIVMGRGLALAGVTVNGSLLSNTSVSDDVMYIDDASSGATAHAQSSTLQPSPKP